MRILNRKISKIIDGFTINCDSNVFPALTINHRSASNYALKTIKYNNITSNILGHLTEHLDYYDKKGNFEYQLENINKVIQNNANVLNEKYLIEKQGNAEYVGLGLAEKLFKAQSFALKNNLSHKKCFSGEIEHTLNHIDVTLLFH
jgi:hypothetical protein